MNLEENQQILQAWEWLSNIMTIESFVKLAVVYFFIVWIAIIVWVIRDITNRSDSIFLQFLSILIVLIGTPFGVFIYLLIRPTKTLFERYYDDVECNLDNLASSIKSRLDNKEETTIGCPACNYPIDNAFKFCPNCKEELKYKCKNCNKKIDKNWKVCAHCGEKKPYKQKKK